MGNWVGGSQFQVYVIESKILYDGIWECYMEYLRHKVQCMYANKWVHAILNFDNSENIMNYKFAFQNKMGNKWRNNGIKCVILNILTN